MTTKQKINPIIEGIVLDKGLMEDYDKACSYKTY